jgi:hypothetical protein
MARPLDQLEVLGAEIVRGLVLHGDRVGTDLALHRSPERCADPDHTDPAEAHPEEPPARGIGGIRPEDPRMP